MNLDDFDFQLPEELIAQFPADERSASRLMHVGQKVGELEHLIFKDIVQLLEPGDLLVRNDVKVLNARLFGRKGSGGKLEFMLERVLDDRQVLSQIRASKAPKIGDSVFVENENAEDAGFSFKVLEKNDGLYRLQLDPDESRSLEELIEYYGHLPLPPYIQRSDEDFDEQRYQTVFAKHPGAVAAPTAGLHFDEELFEQVAALGVDVGETTLYVGSGTFQPVRVDKIEDHKMHSERYVISQHLVDQVQACRERGGRVIALGTTSLRALESASQTGELLARSEETSIFIYPGYQFKCVDALITNFHLPKSTLLMLVSAFAGKEQIDQAYAEAVKEEYRFFSYGDAMFLNRLDS